MNELSNFEPKSKKTKAKKIFKGVVYMYTNKNNGKVYIGETINLKRRQREHIEHKSSMVFHRVIRDETFETFEFSILFECEDENKEYVICKIEEMEEYYIVKYNAIEDDRGYNFSRGVRWGMNGIYWELTEYDRQIGGILTHPHFYQHYGDLIEYREKLIKEREELRIKLGAPY